MTIDDIKTLRDNAYAKLNSLEDRFDYEAQAAFFESAFNLVDKALGSAIEIIESRLTDVSMSDQSETT